MVQCIERSVRAGEVKDSFAKWLMILLLVFGYYPTPAQRVHGDSNYSALPFQTLNGKIPIVKVQINGKPAWMIVDTGASITIVHAAKASYFGFEIARHTEDKMDMTGLGGSTELLETYGCSLKLGDLTIKQRPKAQDLYRLLSTIKAHDKITIVGILGADVLSRNKMTIDYSSNKILYPTPKGNREEEINVCQVQEVF